MGNTEIIIYQSSDGRTKIETRLENETLWLNQSQISEVFQKSKSTISEHISNILKDNELDENQVVRNFRTTASDGKNYNINYYNLDMVIAIGYRVRSTQGTQFRNWATSILKEYLIKGFSMNDELLKEAGGGTYFEELLSRIRDIRSSEKVFYRKILDIYETSVDYNPNSETSQDFFKTIQNKMHFAAHGHTAAEIIFQRANCQELHMGLTTFKGDKPNKKEVQIAKNYLNEDELNILNRIVVAYLEFAELQALNRKPMYMKDWIVKLDDFLKMTGNELLTHKGNRSHQQAINKAKEEYEKYKERTKNELSRVEKDFVTYIEKTEKFLAKKK